VNKREKLRVLWQSPPITERSEVTTISLSCPGISKHRLVSFSDGQITFRWRDSAHRNEQKLLTLSSDEFLRRFLLHILPKGFVRIRNFGFLANRKRAKLLPLCFHLFGATPQPQVASHPSGSKNSSPSWRCPKCGGR
jgi:hypothetical protein